MPPRGYDHPSTSLFTTSSSSSEDSGDGFDLLRIPHTDDEQRESPMDGHQQQTTTPASLSAIIETSHQRHVSFGTAQVRVYSQVLGDHPCCTEGLPVSLGWDYREAGVVDLSATEQQHPCPRLSGEDRRSILQAVLGGAMQVRRIQRQLSRERQRNSLSQKRMLRQSGFFRLCVESE